MLGGIGTFRKKTPDIRNRYIFIDVRNSDIYLRKEPVWSHLPSTM